MADAWKKFINLSIWVAIILFVVRLLLGGVSVFQFRGIRASADTIYNLIGYAGEAIGVTSLIMAIFNKWAWKWKYINALTGKMPILAKAYKGSVISDYDNKERSARLEIEQTFLKVIVKIKTDESQSNTICASLEEIHNEFQLVYIYFNEPRAEIQDRSAIHYGTAMLKISKHKELTGNYYTGRNTKGSMKFLPDVN